MDSFFSMMFNLLITPPGNYLYYVILAVLVGFTLQSTYLTSRGSLDEGRARVMTGMFLVLLIQILTLGSSFMGWAGLADPRQFLPPIDRAAALLMVTIVFWVWAFPERSRFSDTAFIITGGVFLFFLAGNLANQSSFPPEYPYNVSLWDWVWQVLTIIIALIATLTLNSRRPSNWQFGIGFFVLILLGHVINLAVLTNEGSFSGVTRLTMLVAFLLLPTLAQRFQFREADIIQPPLEAAPDTGAGKRDFKELENWLELNSQTDIETFFPALIRLVCLTMKADRGFVVVPSENRGQMTLQAGYNYETGEYFPLTTTSDALLPAITRAALFSRTQFFDHKDNHEELNHLAVTAQIAGIGSALFVPFSAQQKKWGGLLIIKSSTRKALSGEDEERLAALARSASSVLDKIVELGLHAQSLQAMAANLGELREENQTLKDDLKKLNEQSGYSRAEPELNALLAVQQESQDLIASLQRDNRQLLKEMEELRSARDSAVSEEEVETDPARLAGELTTAHERIRILETEVQEVNRSAARMQIVEAVLEELRSPVNDLTQHLEGIVSDASGQDMPEKSVKSLQASLENLHSRLNDLEQMNVLEKGLTGLQPEKTDLNEVIDQTLASVRARLSFKALNLRIELSDQLPTFYSFRGAMKQVLAHVIENAIDASAIGAEVELKVQAVSEPQEDGPYLLFQVTDWGGERNMDDIRRLFARPSPDQNSAGEDGNLFIANHLVEAHGGRMWVDSEKGSATVFSILLPIEPPGIRSPKSES